MNVPVPPGALVFILPKWLAFAFLVVESVGVTVVAVWISLGKSGLP